MLLTIVGLAPMSRLAVFVLGFVTQDGAAPLLLPQTEADESTPPAAGGKTGS